MISPIKAILLMVILLASCQNKDERISPVMEPISESVYASGIVKSKNQYQVFAATNGLIQNIFVRDGDLIKKGDPIMQLMNESSRLNAENAKLAAAYAALDANRDKLTELQTTIEIAARQLQNDSLLFIRQQKLWDQQIGSKIEFEQRELAYRNSKKNYEVAKLRYDDLKRQLEFNSRQAINNLKISTSIANDFIVKAEADGKVYKILKEKGEFANTATPLAIIGDASQFYAELTVDEYDIARLQTGQRVLFTMDSYKGTVFEARITQILPLMNEVSRSFTIYADFVSKPDVLYPNLSLEANIIIRSKEKALTIPRTYLIGDSVVLLRNGSTKKVVTGLKDYRKAEIVSGLTTEDVLILPNL